MVIFFKHLGIGIISAITAFSGAFHQQSSTQLGTSTPELTESVSVKSVTKPATARTAVTPDMSKETQGVTTQVPVAIPAPTDNYVLYTVLPADFGKNPPHYVGARAKVSGRVVDFLAAGDRGGSDNYVEIVPYSLSDVRYLALKLSASDYQILTKKVGKGDTVTAFGVMIPSQTFLNADQFTTTLMPILQTTRIDQCGDGVSCSLKINSQTVFPVTPSNTISKSDRTSLSRIFTSPERFVHTKVFTFGSVIRILQSESTGNSMIFIQDPADGRGLGFLVVNTAYVLNNNIKIGSKLLVDGTILPPNDNDSVQATKEFYSVDISGYYFITAGTVNVED